MNTRASRGNKAVTEALKGIVALSNSISMMFGREVKLNTHSFESIF